MLPMHRWSIGLGRRFAAERSSFSYELERPPIMLRMLAPKSLKKFTPLITSPNTIPLYSRILRPSIDGVVVSIMFPAIEYIEITYGTKSP